ncbi:VanZ family protein [Clostridium sp. DJ247]|uniref:VanZ family protein n=1 Tax=Clostridium sp. DJ247 TaxID=2726188 RepID=UPI001629C2FF|nr:VanZ family protein [Clostridium sp. DJ247]MBC2580178.1 VanZ family protein [Clostridium sp. DJ247]
MKKLFLTMLCIMWMVLIFYNSSNNGKTSNERSYHFLNDIRSEYKNEPKLLNSKLPSNNREERLNLVIRKNAHAFEYLVLALLVSSAFFSFSFKGRGAVIYIMFICLFYAVTDEFHQMFVPGRTSLVSDVLIDFTGSLIGIFIFYFLYYKVIRGKHYSKV